MQNIHSICSRHLDISFTHKEDLTTANHLQACLTNVQQEKYSSQQSTQIVVKTTKEIGLHSHTRFRMPIVWINVHTRTHRVRKRGNFIYLQANVRSKRNRGWKRIGVLLTTLSILSVYNCTVSASLEWSLSFQSWVLLLILEILASWINIMQVNWPPRNAACALTLRY